MLPTVSTCSSPLGWVEGSRRAGNPLQPIGNSHSIFANSARPQQASTPLDAGGWAGSCTTVCAWLAEPVGSLGGFWSSWWLHFFRQPLTEWIICLCSLIHKLQPAAHPGPPDPPENTFCSPQHGTFSCQCWLGQQSNLWLVCKITCHEISNKICHSFQGTVPGWEPDLPGTDARELHLCNVALSTSWGKLQTVQATDLQERPSNTGKINFSGD